MRVSWISIRQEGMEALMMDIIVVTALAIAVFFVVRSQLHKLRSGQCGGGCSGNCAGCQSCANSTEENG